jgi:signal transduction histidine kinase
MEFAHQMRNMLTAMLGSLEHLRRQPLDEHGRHQLARAEISAWGAAELLDRYAPLSGPDQQDRKADEPQ